MRTLIILRTLAQVNAAIIAHIGIVVANQADAIREARKERERERKRNEGLEGYTYT